MENLFFTSTRLQYNGKQGILKPDAEGYYEMPIGALNCKNSLGEFYTDENVEKIFSLSGDLMRKIKDGKLFGEWGHPVQQPGESDRDFMRRSCTINDKETCVFFSKVWITREVTPEMRAFGIPENAAIIMGRFKPMGKLWETLQRSLDDPNVNTSFSGRYLTRDRHYRGVCYVIVEGVVTWDAVGDQGHAVAEKAFATRLESHSTKITPRMVSNLREDIASGSIRMESASGALEVVNTAQRFFAEQKGAARGFHDWVK